MHGLNATGSSLFLPISAARQRLRSSFEKPQPMGLMSLTVMLHDLPAANPERISQGADGHRVAALWFVDVHALHQLAARGLMQLMHDSGC